MAWLLGMAFPHLPCAQAEPLGADAACFPAGYCLWERQCQLLGAPPGHVGVIWVGESCAGCRSCARERPARLEPHHTGTGNDLPGAGVDAEPSCLLSYVAPEFCVGGKASCHLQHCITQPGIPLKVEAHSFFCCCSSCWCSAAVHGPEDLAAASTADRVLRHHIVSTRSLQSFNYLSKKQVSNLLPDHS